MGVKIFIVIPGFNEAKYLHKTLLSASKVSKNIIYVDDGSTDSSASIAKKHVKHLLSHVTNLGKGAALKTGCLYAFQNLGADAVVLMDSDGQHNPQELKKFIKRLKKGAKMIFGVRALDKKMPRLRYVGNKFASSLFKLLYGKYIPDIPSGYKAMDKKTFKKIIWSAIGYEVEVEIASRVAKHNIPYEITNIDTIYHDVDKGVSLLDALNVVKFLVKLRLIL